MTEYYLSGMLSLEALAVRNIPLAGLVYNHCHETKDEIRRDSLDYFRYHLEKVGRSGAVVEIPVFERNDPPHIDFSPLFEGEP